MDSSTLKTMCKKCGGNVEFPSEYRGATVPCPHCGRNLMLYSTSEYVAQSQVNLPAKSSFPAWVKPVAICVMVVSLLVAFGGVYYLVTANNPSDAWIYVFAGALLLFVAAIFFAGGIKYEGYDGTSKRAGGSANKKTDWREIAVGAGAVIGWQILAHTSGGFGFKNILGLVLAVLFFSFGLWLYMLPTIIARKRYHRNTVAIAALNILTGWTFVGWVISLVWALKVE